MLCTKHNDNHTNEKVYAIGDRHELKVTTAEELRHNIWKFKYVEGSYTGEIELLQLDGIKDGRSLHTKITKEQRIMVELLDCLKSH